MQACMHVCMYAECMNTYGFVTYGLETCALEHQYPKSPDRARFHPSLETYDWGTYDLNTYDSLAWILIVLTPISFSYMGCRLIV